MSIFSKTLRKAGSAMSKSKLIRKVVGTAARGLPVIGTAYAAYDIAKEITGFAGGKGVPAITTGRGTSMLPVPPSRSSLSKLPSIQTIGTAGPGLLPRGPGGKLQMPWSDPRTPEVLKHFAIDDAYLKVQYRAPKGYVVVRDASGKPYPLLKWAATKFGLWRPGHKPPISVGEYQALKKADRTVKKMRKIYTQIARVGKATKSGKVCVARRKAA